MKKKLLTSLLVSSLVLSSLGGGTLAFAQESTGIQASFQDEITESSLVESDNFESFSESLMPLPNESIGIEQGTSELFVEESNDEASIPEEITEYERVYYDGQWFDFPVQKEEEIDVEVEHDGIDTPMGASASTSVLRTRTPIDLVTETQKDRPKWDFIDVSSHNGDLSVADYEYMKKHGVTGVVVKLTQGTWYKNPNAANQIKNALAVGMKVSTYHYSEFTTKTAAEAEATFYAKMAKDLNLPNNTVMVNDLEENFNIFSTQNSIFFANKLKEHGFGTTLHYSSAYIFDSGVLQTALLGAKNLWVAQYPYTPTNKNILHTSRSAWQWSSNMQFTQVKFSNGKLKTFDVNMDHTGLLSNKKTSAPEVSTPVENVTEAKVNRYASITKTGYKIWSDNTQTTLKTTSDAYYQKTVYVDSEYVRDNGQKSVSIYDSKNELLGYIDSAALTYASGPGGAYISEGKYVTVHTRNYKLWRGLDFKSDKGVSGQYNGQTLRVRGKYLHYNGSVYYSLYNKKGTWLGYINANGVKIANNQGGTAQGAKFYTTIARRNFTIWQNLNFTKKKGSSNTYLNQRLYVKVKYGHYNTDTYYSLYNSKGTWLGYINKNATR